MHAWVCVCVCVLIRRVFPSGEQASILYSARAWILQVSSTVHSSVRKLQASPKSCKNLEYGLYCRTLLSQKYEYKCKKHGKKNIYMYIGLCGIRLSVRFSLVKYI